MTSECNTLYLNQVVSLEVGMCPGILMHPLLSYPSFVSEWDSPYFLLPWSGIGSLNDHP